MSPATARGWESLFWGLFERAADPALLLDEERRVLEINPPALQLVGFTRGCLIGSPVLDLVAPGERARAEGDWQTLVRGGEHASTATLVTHTGDEVHLAYSARRVPFPGRALALFVGAPLIGDDTTSALTEDEALTAREREIVTLLAQGGDTSEIAGKLYISPETVKTHVRNAMHKLGARTRAQLVAVSLQRHEVSAFIPQPG